MFGLPVVKAAPWYPGQFGIAGTDTANGIRTSTSANVFYVDSTHALANDLSDGTNPLGPLATLAGAIAKCTADQGDIIILAPRHRETWATLAACAALSVAGVTIVGEGKGLDRPRFTMSLAACTLAISAASCKMQNVVFVPGVNHVTIGLTVTATDLELEDVEFEDGGAFHFLSGITTVGVNAADGLKLKNVVYTSDTAGAAQAVNVNAVEDRVKFEGCRIRGNFSAGCIVSGSILTNVLVKGNDAQNLAAATPAIAFTAAATGLIIGNHLAGTVLGSILDPGSCMCLDNWETNAIDTFAVPSPYNAPAGAGWPIAVGVGTKVHRAAGDIMDGTQKALFTIAGGRVLLVGLDMVVSAFQVDAVASLTKFMSNPTLGTDLDLCTAATINAAVIGASFGITGNPADALMGVPAGGGHRAMYNPIILNPGTLDLNTTLDAGAGGALAAVDAWYIPLDAGATLA